MEIVNWNISVDKQTEQFDIRRTDGKFRCSANGIRNLILQLGANGFDERDCLEAVRQLVETPKAAISVRVPFVRVRQLW